MQKLTIMCERLRSANASLRKGEIDSLNTMVQRLSRLMEWRQGLCTLSGAGGGGGGRPGLAAGARADEEMASVGVPTATLPETQSHVPILQ